MSDVQDFDKNLTQGNEESNSDDFIDYESYYSDDETSNDCLIITLAILLMYGIFVLYLAIYRPDLFG